MDPVFTRMAVERFTPPGCPRAYDLAPLTFRERQAFNADMARDGGMYPSRAQLLDAMRRVVRELAPSNAEPVIDIIDAAEADPDGNDRAVQEQISELEFRIAEQPAYANLVAARVHYAGMLPFIAARHALRGWEGPSLPPFVRIRGLVPDAVLELLPHAELRAIGERAAELMRVGPSAEGNSAPPSP
ncbi:hypothetical protein [Sandarakinorhabdus sp.]|uniref:hypothetical protein n=1 Tax=Sandarakinorhabdus sp. TaxID=1916663 RepID=UPI0035695468